MGYALRETPQGQSWCRDFLPGRCNKEPCSKNPWALPDKSKRGTDGNSKA